MQESKYEVDAKNVRCGFSEISGENDCVIIDFGIGQINHQTIKRYNFDRSKLLSDLTYSVEAAAIVLSDFKKAYGSREPDYWSRYNAASRPKREVYKDLVTRFL